MGNWNDEYNAALRNAAISLEQAYDFVDEARQSLPPEFRRAAETLTNFQEDIGEMRRWIEEQ